MTRNFTKYLVAAALAAAALWPATAAAEKAVVVVSRDGTQTEVVLSRVKHIEIGATSATLHHSEGTHELAFGDIDRILIGSDAAAVKGLLKDGEFAVWADGSTICATGLEPGAAFTAHSVAGALMGTATADADGNAKIDLTGSQPGVYIASAGKNSVKIITQ